MSESEELYREVILDHYKNPRQSGKLEHPDHVEAGANPLCGDELELQLAFRDGKVSDIRFNGKGCSISQSSASIMAESVKGKTLAEAEKLIGGFRLMMLEGGSPDDLPEDLEDAKALDGVKKYPVRVKCAMLAWNTLRQALKKQSGGKPA
jgi:nitrogen fixation NifU-like protein